MVHFYRELKLQKMKVTKQGKMMDIKQERCLLAERYLCKQPRLQQPHLHHQIKR